MATTEHFFTGNASTTSFGFTFPILQNSDLKVELDGVLKTENTSGTNNDYSIVSTNVVMNSAPGSGVDIHIYRQTDVDTPKAVFAAGSSIRAGDLNNIVDQALYASQEQQQKVRTADVRDHSVTSVKIKDGAILNADINANADIENSKIADGLLKSGITVNSANIVDGSIVNDDVSNSANISGSKLADDSVGLTKLGSGALPTDITVSRDNIVNGTIQDADIETGTLDNRYYTETELDNGQLNNQYYTETELNAGQLDNRYFTETELTGGSLDGRYYTETELSPTANAGQNVLDARYYTETESEALFLRQDSSETIASGEPWSNTDGKVATTAAINARIIDLVDDIGGFTVLANETSFPNTNPQGSTGQAAIMSISSLSQAYTPTGTTVTIANGTVGNSTVTITGVPSVLPQGFGILVESTATLNTYTFHRLVPKATQVTTVANAIAQIIACGNNLTDIENFADLYQISTSAPTTRADGGALTVGDLWFDSSSNQVMMVYDGSSGDGFSPITPDQSTITAINSVSGHVTFTEDLGLITNAINTGSGNNSINTCGANIASINTVAADLNETTSEIDTVATNIANVNNVGNSITNVDAVANNATNINAVQANASNINTVAGINANVTTVAGISSNVTAVAGNAANINAVNSNATNINAVNANSNNINTVAGNNTNVTTVAGKATEIGRLGTADAVADMNTLGTSAIVSDMDTLADISSNITTVAGISSNVTTVANNNSNVTAVASNATNINTVATNVSDVNNFVDRYQISSSAPTQRSDGSALQNGDLWFNNTSVAMESYDGSAGDGYTPIQPSATVIQNIANVTGFVTFVEDNGLITDAINTGTGNNSINTVGADIANVNTVAGSIANVNTTAGNISNVNTVATNIASVNNVSGQIANVNRYADEYVIQGSTPSSPSEGDLWYNSTANTLNYYNSTAWVAIAPGISGVVNDANPQLANHLDCNDKNLTEVATISGNNLQIDFGTL